MFKGSEITARGWNNRLTHQPTNEKASIHIRLVTPQSSRSVIEAAKLRTMREINHIEEAT
jgi:hypothetical protein